MWYAFGKTFEVYDNAISFPFSWNPIQKQMYFNKGRVQKTLVSILIMFIAFICCGVNIWYLMTIRTTWSTLNCVQVVVSLLQFFLGFLIICIAIYFTQNGAEMAVLFTDSYRAMRHGKSYLEIKSILNPPQI